MNIPCQRARFSGCIPDSWWEQSGVESATAVAGVAYRLWARRSAGAKSGRTVASASWGGCEGRHKAGSCGDLMGQAGRGLAGHVRIGTCYEYRHPVDEARHGLGGALRGRSPRTREGRLGPTAQMRGERGEKRVTGSSGADGNGDRSWSELCQRIARVHPHFGMHTFCVCWKSEKKPFYLSFQHACAATTKLAIICQFPAILLYDQCCLC